VFDPFDSPWKPVAPPPRADQAAAPPAASASSAPDFDSIDDLRAAVDAHERTIVEHALGKHRWNQRQTAKALGLTYDQLRHCIKKHALADDS
jgi:psp operon transcriptional activator